ncbi:unnamed protein product [Boreogadus saida]
MMQIINSSSALAPTDLPGAILCKLDERLQTTATDLTASASRRPPRTSRRAPPDDRHGPHGEHLQTTATDLTASTSRRPPRTSRRAPPDDRHGPHGERLQTTATDLAWRAPPDDRHGPHGEHLQTTTSIISTERRYNLFQQWRFFSDDVQFHGSPVCSRRTERLLATIHLQLPAPDPLR